MSHFPRDRQPEQMDDPQLDEPRLLVALRGLARLNALSGGTRVVWQPIVRMAHQRHLQCLRVLDLATGSGDIPRRLCRRAQRCGLQLEILGLDVNPHAIQLARQRAAEEHLPVEFDVLNVLTDPLPSGFDVVIASLFLHHLENTQAIRLLDQMRCAAQRLGLVNDLVRSRVNLMFVKLATHLCTRSAIVRVDGPLSVNAAFTPAEIAQLASSAGIKNAVLSRHWPCRMLLQWQTTS